ncbi:MAG: cytochrome c-type biogenesis protein CcmH [Candidatus Binatia bacterium]
MRAFRRCFAAAIFSLSLLLPFASPAPAAKSMGQQAVEEGLTCQCGCGLTVAACNHLECGFAIPVRKDIAESLARGETGEAILARYKAEYGEKVLSSPVPEGFNILAWIGPYIAIVVAGIVMFTFFRRRASAEAPAAEPLPPVSAQDQDRAARLRDELEDMDR